MLSAWNYAYMETTESQQLSIGHAAMCALEFFVLHRAVGPRNPAQPRDEGLALRTGREYTYHVLAEHYGVAVLSPQASRPADRQRSTTTF